MDKKNVPNHQPVQYILFFGMTCNSHQSWWWDWRGHLHSTSRGRSRVLSSDHLPIQPAHSGLRLDVLASRGWSRWDWGHGRHIADSATSQKLWVCGETTSISENWRENFHIWRFPKMRVSPNHLISVGFSIINYPFWVLPIYENSQSPKQLETMKQSQLGLMDKVSVRAWRQEGLLGVMHFPVGQVDTLHHTAWERGTAHQHVRFCLPTKALPFR